MIGLAGGSGTGTILNTTTFQMKNLKVRIWSNDIEWT
jgi:hypothetical protein